MSTPPRLWTVVVPVKGTADGKSRLMPERSAEERVQLAEAFTLDAVAALQAARRVAAVIVVTDAASPIAARLREAGVVVLPDPGRGLNAAVAVGIAVAGERGAASIAAVLGDLPTLRAADVDEALGAAEAHPLSFVADAEGSGTTLIAAGGVTLVPRFGAGSAARHREAGHVELPLGESSTLRHDVDTEVELQAALSRGVGEATRDVLERLSPPAASAPSSRR